MTKRDLAGMTYASVLAIRMHPKNDVAGQPDYQDAIKWARFMAALAAHDFSLLEEKCQSPSAHSPL